MNSRRQALMASISPVKQSAPHQKTADSMLTGHKRTTRGQAAKQNELLQQPQAAQHADDAEFE